MSKNEESPPFAKQSSILTSIDKSEIDRSGDSKKFSKNISAAAEKMRIATQGSLGTTIA